MSKMLISEHKTAAIVLFSAICMKFSHSDIVEELNLAPDNVADVVLTVNGVEIPFEPTVEEMWRQVNEDVDRRALKLAEEIISGAKLQGVFDAVRRAEWEISTALENALKEIKDGSNGF